MTKRAKDLFDLIKLYKDVPVSFIFLRRETSYTPQQLRAALDELKNAKKIRQDVEGTGIVYKAVSK
jgi:NADH:ubiquinone oxidoreductase subunit F (NADH-binding)